MHSLPISPNAALFSRRPFGCAEVLPIPISGYVSSDREAPRKTACPAGCHLPLPAISNRHLVRLEFVATHTESTTSLFLIVSSSHICAHTQAKSPEILVAQARPACVRFPAPCKHTTSISNRHLVQLEFNANRLKSTSSLFLIDPRSRICTDRLALCRSHRREKIPQGITPQAR